MFRGILFALAVLLFSTSSLAQTKINHWGGQLDVGLPDGLALGPVYAPLPWMRLNLSAAHNTFAPGLRMGLTWDPITFPIVPTLTAEAGHYFGGYSFLAPDKPGISYDYANLHLGFEIGKRNSWRIFIHAGPSWIHLKTSDLNRIFTETGFSTGEAEVSGTVFPTAKIGFAAFF